MRSGTSRLREAAETPKQVPEARLEQMFNGCARLIHVIP